MTGTASDLDVLRDLIQRLTSAAALAPRETDRDRFIALHSVLGEWIIAAKATNAATDFAKEAEWQEQGQSMYIAMLVDPQTLREHGIEASRYWPDEEQQERFRKVRQLLDIYAPDSASQIDSWLTSRAIAVDRLRAAIGSQDRQRWRESLRHTLDGLESAQEELRQFITTSFPLGDRRDQVINISGGTIGIIGDGGAASIGSK